MVVTIGPASVRHARYQQEAAAKLVSYMRDSANSVSQSFLHGEAWQHLGQTPGEPVDPQLFESVLRGEHPQTGKPLGQVQNYTEVHQGVGRVRSPVAGLDVVISPFSKEISALYVMGTPRQRAILHRILVAVVQFILTRADTLVPTRRGKGGSTREYNGAALWCCHIHLHNRHGNAPQIHVHAFRSALVRSAQDTRWTKSIGREMYAHAHSLGALARLTTSYELQRLGVQTVPYQHGGLKAYKLAGFPDEFGRELSSRSNEIEAVMQEKRLSTPAEAKRVALQTRGPKAELSFPALRERTWEVAERHGITREHVASLFSSEQAQSAEQLYKCSAQPVADALASARCELAVSRPDFEPRHLLREVAERLQASGASPGQVLRAIEPHVIAHNLRLEALPRRQDTTRSRVRETVRVNGPERAPLPVVDREHQSQRRAARPQRKQQPGRAPRLHVGERVTLASHYHLAANRIADNALVRLTRKLSGANNGMRFARKGETGVVERIETKRIWRRLPFTRKVVVVRLDWRGRRGFLAARTVRFVRIRANSVRFALVRSLDIATQPRPVLPNQAPVRPPVRTKVLKRPAPQPKKTREVRRQTKHSNHIGEEQSL